MSEFGRLFPMYAATVSSLFDELGQARGKILAKMPLRQLLLPLLCTI